MHFVCWNFVSSFLTLSLPNFRDADNFDLICRVCQERSSSQLHVVKHFRQKHDSFFCDMCKVHFFDKSDMQLHVRLTHNQKMRTCAECDEVFRSRQSLDNHLEFFHTDKPHIVCRLCQRAFIMKRKFLEHLWLHVGKRVRRLTKDFYLLKCDCVSKWKLIFLINNRRHLYDSVLI